MAKRQTLDFFESVDEYFADYLKVHTDKDEDEELIVIPTGSLALDVSMGTGGIPLRKFTEIYGVESSGKTTLALSIAGNALRLGYNVLYVDAEQAIEFNRVELIAGKEALDPKRFVLLQPEYMESALQICENGIKSRHFGLIIIDSIASMTPKKVKDDDLDDSNPFILSRKMTTFVQRNAYDVNHFNVAFLGLNQVRDDTHNTYLKTYSTPGGHQWKHLLSIRVQLSKASDIEKGDEKIGILSKFTVKKNKLAPPLRTSNIPILFDRGVDVYRDVIEFATSLGVISRSGAYYKFGDVSIGKGMENSIKFLKESPETLDKIREMCYYVINRQDLVLQEINDE